MTLLTNECCLGYPDAQPCGKPVRYYALSACPPDLWNGRRPSASLGGFCSLEHANAEPRPTLSAAERIYQQVVQGDGCMCGHCGAGAAITAWRRLLDAFPNPVPV